MERYAARLSGTSAADVDRARRNALLDAANRNAARIHENNFTSNDSRKKISAEQQYAALWNSAFFAAGIKPDSSHRSLAASCYGKNISFLKISALTSYIYDVTLIDTVADRRTSFTVYPESSTFILATPGMHLLICKSSFQPAPGQLWRSAPTIIPLMVPQSPSLVSFTLETRVVREKGKE
jgi:hypothetical protein